MFGGVLGEPCAGAEGSLSICPLPSPPPPPPHRDYPDSSPALRASACSQRSPLGLEANLWQQKMCLSPKSQDRWAQPEGLCVAKATGARVGGGYASSFD